MSPQDFNIAIVGAGIGGLALAIGLNHLEVPFTLYESAKAFSAVGAGVGLGPNALRAMDMIDSRFRDMYMNIATGNLNPEKKHVMMEAMRMENGLGEGESWWGHGGWGADYFERTGAHRKDLLDIMTSFISKDCVRFNKKVKTMTLENEQVTLTFDDGETVRHAAAVGSDGVKGATRRIVLGERFPGCVDAEYTGKYVYRAIVPMTESRAILGDLAADAKMYMSRGANISTYPIGGGGQMNVVAFKRDAEHWRYPDSTYKVSREDMLDDFSCCDADPRLMKLLDWAQPIRWGIFHHLNTPTYYHSLICMLGDVAHAGGPHQGAGAGQCLEDALILSRVLGKLHRSIPTSTMSTPSPLRTKYIEAAFDSYDQIRRPRAQEQVRTSHACGELYNLMDPVAGTDIVRSIENLNQRFAWIWEHNLANDVEQAESRFDELAGLVSDFKEESARL